MVFARNLLSLILAGAIMALVFPGCGNKESKPTAPVARIDPSSVGTISGTVTLTGTPPALKPIDMSASAACVQANKSPVVPPLAVTGENGTLANVVVYVKSGLGNYRYDAPKDPVILHQETACTRRTWSR